MVSINIDKSTNLKNQEMSAYVSFDYRADVLDVLRSLSKRTYDAKHRTWEIPVYSIANVCNALPHLEVEIKGIVTREDNKTNQELPEGFTFKTKPYAHQLEGVYKGLRTPAFLLGDDQGCISGECTVWVNIKGTPATYTTKLKNLYKRLQNHELSMGDIKVKSLVNGRFSYVSIADVLYQGNKPTITIDMEDGYSVTCTPDHEILTSHGWIRADSLSISDDVIVNGDLICPRCGSNDNICKEPGKFQGYCRSCMYLLRDGGKYKDTDRKRLTKDGYVLLLGKKYRSHPMYDKVLSGILEHHYVMSNYLGRPLDLSYEVVHHLDHNRSNNDISNLIVMTKQEHYQVHEATYTRSLPQNSKDVIFRGNTPIYYVPRFKEVTDIIKNKAEDVYDIKLNCGDIHNFIANGVVVHNCGKTKQIIDIAVARKIKGEIKRCLIVCGINSTKYNWQAEIGIHSNESAWVLGTRYTKSGKMMEGGNKERLEDLSNLPDAFFIITNIEALRGLSSKTKGNKWSFPIAEKLLELCETGEIGMIAVDEIHKCKNPDSQQGRALLLLDPDKENFPKIPMSGTFVLNNPLDLYLPLKWAGYEDHKFYAYKNHYCRLGGFGGKEVIGYRNLADLREIMTVAMLRRTKAEVLDLPPKVHYTEYVDMYPDQRKLYEQVKKAVREEVDKVKLHPDPLSMLIRLRQVTGYPGILSTTITKSAKFDRVLELVEEENSVGGKCIVYSQWETMTKLLKSKLQQYNPAYITGAVSATDRMAEVNKFQTDPNCRCIIGTIGAMGTGLTLNVASTVIFIDEPWNRSIKDQAEDRAHRIGTKGMVRVVTVIAKDTIDERIMNLVQKKGKTADFLIDGKFDSTKSAKLIDYMLS